MNILGDTVSDALYVMAKNIKTCHMIIENQISMDGIKGEQGER